MVYKKKEKENNKCESSSDLECIRKHHKVTLKQKKDKVM